MKFASHEQRELVQEAEKAGYQIVRRTGKKHLLLRHSNGSTVLLAGTPGSRQSRRNALADIRRGARKEAS